MKIDSTRASTDSTAVNTPAQRSQPEEQITALAHSALFAEKPSKLGCSRCWKCLYLLAYPLIWLCRTIAALFCCLFQKQITQDEELLQYLKNVPVVQKWAESAINGKNSNENRAVALSYCRQWQAILLQQLQIDQFPKMSAAEKTNLLNHYCFYLRFTDLLMLERDTEPFISHRRVHAVGSVLHKMVIDEIGLKNLGNTCWFNSALQLFLTNLELIDFGTSLSIDPNSRAEAMDNVENALIRKTFREFARTFYRNQNAVKTLYERLIRDSRMRTELTGIGSQEEPGKLLLILLEAFGLNTQIRDAKGMVTRHPLITAYIGDLKNNREIVQLFFNNGQNKVLPGVDWLLVQLVRVETSCTKPDNKRNLIDYIQSEAFAKELSEMKDEEVRLKYFIDRKEVIEGHLGHQVSVEDLTKACKNYQTITPETGASLKADQVSKESCYYNYINRNPKKIDDVKHKITLESALKPLFQPLAIRKIAAEVEFEEGGFVDIPTEGEEQNVRYRIEGCIIHKGMSVYGGHYVALRHGADGQERVYDDSSVFTCSTEDARKSYQHAYYLYLKRT